MTCDCTTYGCLEVLLNPCSNGVELPLVATGTGTWSINLEFNGTWIRLSIAVTSGDNIIIPNILNEFYVHQLRIYNAAGDLLNDTCYKLSSIRDTSATFTPDAPSGECCAPEPIRMIAAAGFTITASGLAGNTPWGIIFMDNQPFDWADNGVTYDKPTGTFDFTNSQYGALAGTERLNIPYNEG